MSKILIAPTLPVVNHYTIEWAHFLPRMLRNAGFDVIDAGEYVTHPCASAAYEHTDGSAFLPFADHMAFNGHIASAVCRYLMQEDISVLLVTDAFNPVVMAAKYVIAMHQLKTEIVVLWHAGTYDPHDFPGKVNAVEREALTLFEKAIQSNTHNLFATDFHRKLAGLPDAPLVGWPMDYLPDLVDEYVDAYDDRETEPEVISTMLALRDAGEKIVLFPHRCSPEKGADFLAANSIDYRIGGHTLVKLDPTDKLTYHKALSLCDVVLSCALQETLGITMYEAALHGVAVVVPNRLSYVEMYPEHVRYDTAEQMHAAVASAQRLTCDELDHLHTFFRSKRLFALLDTLS